MKKLLIPLVLLLCAQPGFSQAAASLLVPADSRSLAMGGVTLPSDAGKLDIHAFYGMWAPQTANNSLFGGDALYRISNRIEVTVEGRFFQDQPYEQVTDKGQIKDSFRPSDMILSAGASVAVYKDFYVTLKARYLTSSIAENAKGSAFCGDLSVDYAGSLFYGSLGVRNIGSKISYGGDSYALPGMVALQGGIKPIHGLTAGAEVDYLFSGALMAGVGAEYGIADIAFVRAGYHYGDAQKALASFASLGLGVKFAGVKLDATWLTASPTLGNSILISLGYEF